MMKPTRPNDIDTSGDPDSIAAAWLARLEDGQADRAGVDEWLSQSPGNRAAWDRMQRLWSDLALVEDDPAVQALRAEAHLAPGRPAAGLQDRRNIWRAAAAVAGVAVLGGGGIWLSRGPQGDAGSGGVFTTAIGQRANYRLADGSLVTLNTDSAVRLDGMGKERRLTLLRGQAFFEVAKDARRPFIVSAGGKSVTAVGTAFDVRLDRDRLAVVLVQGRVRIAGSTPQGDRTVEMAAGSQLIADDKADWRVSEIDTAQAASWLKGQLVFDGQPLSAVVAEMNRFSARKLRIADPRLEATPISGVFRTGEVDAFAKALQAYGLARVVGPTEQEVVLARP